MTSSSRSCSSAGSALTRERTLSTWRASAGATASNEAVRSAKSSCCDVEARFAASAVNTVACRFLDGTASVSLESVELPLPSNAHIEEIHRGRCGRSVTRHRRWLNSIRSRSSCSSSPRSTAQLSAEMDESKMTATAADLERALVESLADAAMPADNHGDQGTDSALATDGNSAEQTQLGDAEGAAEPAYQDGDLPDFSDEEADQSAAATPTAGPRLAPSAKGPGGRRKVPIAALKARLGAGGSSGSSPSAPASGAKKVPAAAAAPPPASAAVSAAASASVGQDKGKGKGKSRELKLSDSQLDAVAQRIAAEHPELPKLSPEQVQELVSSMQIDKDVLSGKKGLMGKGTKDMACVAVAAGSQATQSRVPRN